MKPSNNKFKLGDYIVYTDSRGRHIPGIYLRTAGNRMRVSLNHPDYTQLRTIMVVKVSNVTLDEGTHLR